MASPRDSKAIRILIVDDHALVRQGLAAFLGSEGLDVVGMASSGEESVRMARALHPDVALMDVSMPNMDGVAATVALVQADPGCRVIGLSIRDDEDMGNRMRQAGACGFVSKADPPEALCAAIRSVGRRDSR